MPAKRAIPRKVAFGPDDHISYSSDGTAKSGMENKYKQDNTKLSSMNTKLKKDLQQVNNSLGEANVQMEVLKKKLLDAEEKSRKLESSSQATAKHVEKLKKDRDKAITQAQRHYENYEGLKEKHKITEEEIALLKKEKIQARMIINPSSTKNPVVCFLPQHEFSKDLFALERAKRSGRLVELICTVSGYLTDLKVLS